MRIRHLQVVRMAQVAHDICILDILLLRYRLNRIAYFGIVLHLIVLVFIKLVLLVVLLAAAGAFSEAVWGYFRDLPFGFSGQKEVIILEDGFEVPHDVCLFLFLYYVQFKPERLRFGHFFELYVLKMTYLDCRRLVSVSAKLVLRSWREAISGVLKRVWHTADAFSNSSYRLNEDHATAVSSDAIPLCLVLLTLICAL